MYEIKTLALTDVAIIDHAATTLGACFRKFSPAWVPTRADCLDKIKESFRPGCRSRVLIDQQQNVHGWIGAIEGEHVWEIHPLAVSPNSQRRGFGTMLVNDIMQLAKSAGAVSVWAGTGDETGATSLSKADLYQNPLTALGNITAEEDHPIHFWIKSGFTLVGVQPDEEGLGKPGIHFAKRIS